MVHAVGISTARVRFLRERRRGNKGEERGSARRGRRAGGRVTKRRKKGERRGVRYEGRGVRVESRPDAGKRRSAQCTKVASTARCRSHTKTGCYRSRHRRRSQGTQRNDPACVARSTKHRAWDMTSTQTFLLLPTTQG